MKNSNILFLAWYLDTRIGGGMAKASAGILNTLAKKHNITAILPIQPLYDINSSVSVIFIDDIINIKAENTTSVFSLEKFSLKSFYSPYNTCIQDVENRENPERDNLTDSIQNYIAAYNSKVVEAASNLNFDIIYCHDWITMMAGIRLKLLTGKKLLVHIHSLEYDRYGEDSRNWVYYLERKAMDMADSIISVSHYTKNIAVKYYDIYPEKINVIHPITNEQIVREKAQKKSTCVNLLYVGRLAPQKGVLHFIQICEKIHLSYPDIKFIITGEGELQAELNERIENSFARQNFVQLGFLNETEKNELYPEIDIFCHTSISEPFGLAALEAALHGIPCILSRNSGIAEILTESIRINPLDTDGYACAILSLLESDSLKKLIINGQYENLKKAFTESYLSKFEKVIFEL
ncbi:MAG: glycosyltransferase [Cytophagaceae bacterium]|nr:glycosyltransferase [Cytophagaceae bacterium]MDW8455583.1 glycosyltransferase [Cytophagaceae bacterium]